MEAQVSGADSCNLSITVFRSSTHSKRRLQLVAERKGMICGDFQDG